MYNEFRNTLYADEFKVANLDKVNLNTRPFLNSSRCLQVNLQSLQYSQCICNPTKWLTKIGEIHSIDNQCAF